jgi:hypothetical protein
MPHQQLTTMIVEHKKMKPDAAKLILLAAEDSDSSVGGAVGIVIPLPLPLEGLVLPLLGALGAFVDLQPVLRA